MAPKRPSTSPAGGDTPKRARKTYTLEEKLEVLGRVEKGQRNNVIQAALGMNEATVRCIKRNATKIRESAKAGTPLKGSQSSYTRPVEMQRMEKMLATWIEHQNKTRVPISLALIKAKAVSIYDTIEGEKKPFLASNGWFNNFQKRHGFHNLKMVGEASSADARAAAEYPAELQKIIEDGEYSPKQVFNIDETGLYWKKLPNGTYISKEEASAPGFKASKDRLTLLLGANAEGDCKLKPALVYHSENPRALKGYVKSLPCHWYSNPKGWMTGTIFKDYLGKMEKELELYCKREDLPFKILLILDNAPSYPPSVENLSSNIQLAYLPPNTTSLIQPWNQGVIKTFKSYYLRSTFTDMVERTNKYKLTVKEYWKNFTIRDAIGFIKESWEQVPRKCLNGVWKNLCPQLVYNFTGFYIQETVSQSNRECLAKAKEVGFHEIEEKDIAELLESHCVDLSNEELLEREKLHSAESQSTAESRSTPETPETERVLTRKDLEKALSLIRDALDILEANDPNCDRSTTVARKVMADINCYKIMLAQKKRVTTQTKQSQFFNMKPVKEEEGEQVKEGQRESEEEASEPESGWGQERLVTSARESEEEDEAGVSRAGADCVISLGDCEPQVYVDVAEDPEDSIRGKHAMSDTEEHSASDWRKYIKIEDDTDVKIDISQEYIYVETNGEGILHNRNEPMDTNFYIKQEPDDSGRVYIKQEPGDNGRV